MSFIKDTLFRHWAKTDIILSCLGFISFALPEQFSWKYKVLFVCGGFLLAFVVKLVRQSYDYYLGMNRPLKVLGSSQGEGIYSGKTIIRIENCNNLRDNTLLTLSCKGSSANQTICIVEIVKCIRGEDILAVQIMPDPSKSKTKKYFNEESRLNSLYAIPLINNVELNQLNQNNIP